MYTRQQTMELIRKAAARTPNRRNPKEGFFCRYTSKGGGSHCIAGQLMKDVGIGAPPFDEVCGFDTLLMDSDEYSEKLGETFDSGALSLISLAQDVFDNTDGDTRPLRMWKDALVALEQQLEGDDG